MYPELLAILIVIFLFSVIVHEVMHGLVALKFGDHTAQKAGRLTLNPIPHIDPIGSILLPGFLILSGSGLVIGWAKPVPVNPLNFRDIRKGELLVSAAGILSNIGLAAAAAILYHLATFLYPNFFILQILEKTVSINLLLAVLNVLPIPPLDGSKIVLSRLPYHAAREFQKIEPFGFLIIFLLWMIPIGGSNLLFLIINFGVSILKFFLGF